MPREHDLLSIYLADHRAIFSGVEKRLDQMRGYTELPFAHEIDQMHRDVMTEMIWLEAFCKRGEVPRGRIKQGATRLAERLGRLKLNGTIRSTSALSPMLEIELLTAAVTTKIRLWETLSTLPTSTQDGIDLGELLDQAHQHYEDAARWHRQLRQRTFSPAL
ncbi:MAG: hypothetical protein WBG36_15215 [Ornithinimicrobium sp.]